MKTVYQNNQIAHLWAHGLQDTARNATRSYCFTGPVIYSYGQRRAIAYRYAHAGAADPLYIINADVPSATTGRHTSMVRAAIPHGAPVAYVDGLTADDFMRQQWQAALLRRMRDAVADAADSLAGTKMRATRQHANKHGETCRAIESARVFADHVLSDPDADAGTRRTARAVRAAVTSPAALALENCNSANNAQSFAREIGRSRARDAIRGLVERHAHYATRCERGPDDYLRDPARAHADAVRARDIATMARDRGGRYGLRVPRMRDTSADIEHWGALHHAREVADNLDRLRRAITRTLCDRRAGRAPYPVWLRNAGAQFNAPDHVMACVISPARVAMVQYARDLLRAMERRDAAESVCPEMTAATLRDAEERPQNAPRALAEYSRACAAVPWPTHPKARALAELQPLADRVRAAGEAWRAAADARDAAAIEAWRAGTARSVPQAYNRPPMLRIAGDTIETSHGAAVPTSAAPRLWRLIEAARTGDAAAVSARFRGAHVGPFTLRAIEQDGTAIIGCHRIPYAELHRAAAALGLQ